MRDAFIKHKIYHLEGSEIHVNRRTIMFIQYYAKRKNVYCKGNGSYQLGKLKKKKIPNLEVLVKSIKTLIMNLTSPTGLE